MATFLAAPSGVISDYIVGAQCSTEGGAMYDPPTHDSIDRPWPKGETHGPHCFLIAAPPVVIGSSYMSGYEGFQHINRVFRVNGNQPSVPTYLGLEGILSRRV